MSNIEKLIKQQNLSRTEGAEGVRNLARLCAQLGYEDKQYFGQFDGASYGNLINFLEDNSGAVEAIINFIKEHEDEYDVPLFDVLVKVDFEDDVDPVKFAEEIISSGKAKSFELLGKSVVFTCVTEDAQDELCKILNTVSGVREYGDQYEE